MDRKELKFFIAADMMMNRGTFSHSLKEKVHCFFRRDLIMDYLKAMRYKQYYGSVEALEVDCDVGFLHWGSSFLERCSQEPDLIPESISDDTSVYQ